LLFPIGSLQASPSGGIVDPGIEIPISGADSPDGKRIMGKLNSIIIEKVNFDKVDITPVIEFLSTKSKELDIDHVGLKFYLEWPQPSAVKSLHLHREINITLENIPISELLAYICAQTNLSYKITHGKVVIAPPSLLPPDSASH